MKKAVFPGSFDPFTKGHESIITKALMLFDEIVIGIGSNTKKSSLFLLKNRIEHIHSLYINDERVIVKEYTGLTIDFCKKQGASNIIRGLRNSSDFNYEQTIDFMNKEISNIESVFFLADMKLLGINSSIVREIYINKGDISKFVTNHHLLV